MAEKRIAVEWKVLDAEEQKLQPNQQNQVGNPHIKKRGIGGRERVRTADPLLAKQVLSQLSYTPTATSRF